VTGQVIQQRGLAHTDFAAHHQCPAFTRPDSLDQPVKHLTFASPALQLRDACTTRDNYGHLAGVGVGAEQDRQNRPGLPAHQASILSGR
jgi:hypothetical protein